MQFGIEQWCIAYVSGDQFVQWNDWTTNSKYINETTAHRGTELRYARESAQRQTLQVQDWAVYTRILTPSAPVRAA